MAKSKRILVVEDDYTVYPILTRMIFRLNPDVGIDFAASVEAAENLIKASSQSYDVVLSDISLTGDRTGIDLVHDLTFGPSSVPFVLTSSTSPGFESLMPFLAKPFRYEDFAEMLSPYLD